MRVVEGRARIDDLDAFLGELTAIGEATGCTVQAFDARYVVDREHLARALELADRAIARGENVARDRGVEVLLYAAGRRQIDRALELGVSEGETPVAVLVAAEAARDGDETNVETESGAEAETNEEAEAEAAAADRVAARLEPADTLGAYEEGRVRDYFDVTATELEATAGTLADVIHERVALLDVRK